MSEVVELLQLGYMQRAIVAGAIAGVMCPAIGLFLVLRRYALIGDGLGHVAFAGLTGAWLVGSYPLVGAGVFALFGALGLERLRTRLRDYGDVALAIVFYTGLALGVVFAGISRNMNVNLLGYLFGSILTVTELDLAIMAAAACAVILTLLLLEKELFTLSYDEDVARASGLPVVFLNFLVVILAAITVVAALRVLGVLLVAGLLVIPVAASLQLARSFRGALLYAVALGLLSVLVGLVAAYAFDLAPGGSIILASVLVFLAAATVRTVGSRARVPMHIG